MKKHKGVMPAFIYPPAGVPQNFMRAMHKSYKAGAFQHDWASELGTRVGLARTLNFQTFLDSDAEWIFLVDTDMLWEPSEVIKLRKYAEGHKIKVISGFTPMLKQGIIPHAYKYHEEEDRYLPLTFVEVGGEPFKVDAAGGACMLVHRQVLEDVAEHTKEFTNYYWSEEEYVPGRGIHRGQDLVFCDRVRRYTDHEIWYHPGAYFLHMKLTPYGPKEYLRYLNGLQEKINAKLHSTDLQPTDQ